MIIRKGAFKSRLKECIMFLDYVLWLLLDPSKFKRIKRDQIKKVALIHQGAIGEILITTILAETLKKDLGCEIIYMLPLGKDRLVKGNPSVSKAIEYTGNIWQDAKVLKEEKCDLALIFQASFKNSFLCKLAGIKYRVGGFGGLRRSPSILFTRRIFPICHQHSVECNLNMIRKIGLDSRGLKPKVFSLKEEDLIVNSKLKKLGIKKYMVIHPGFGKTKMGFRDPSRLWSIKKYAEVINRLVKKYPHKIILTGLREEKELISDIMVNVSNKKRTLDASGLFNLGEMISLIKNAKLVIAPDTGVSHIAASLGVPLVNLEGRSGPEEWGPVGNYKLIKNLYHREQYRIFESLKKPLIFEGGLNAITPQEVISAIEKLLR